MMSMKTMTPLKSSKQTSAVASKIKNKILNTSSFFKVSLKTNNKALALALQAQKERSRQLEIEVVHLQKQVKALCFELATKKYKQRKLQLISKNLLSCTQQHLEMMVDLSSDSDCPERPEDCFTLNSDNVKDVAAGRLADLMLLQPEISRNLLCPAKNIAAKANPPERNTEEDVFNVQSRHRKTTDYYNDAEKRHSGQPIQMTLTGTSQTSSSNLPENSTPFLSGGDNPSSDFTLDTESQLNKPEKTVLLNTAMEMTISEPAEIITVETKAKKKRRSCKLKGTRFQEKAHGFSGEEQTNSDLRPSEAAAGTLSLAHVQPPEDRDLEARCPQLPKKASRSLTKCHIPKPDNPQKTSKNKSKSCDTDLPDMDDYFADPKVVYSKTSGSAPDKYATLEASSKVTCRRSRTKVSLSVSLPSERRRSSQECVSIQNEAEIRHLQQPEEFLFCAEEVVNPESEHTDCLSPDCMRKTQSNPRCRRTFVIPVSRESTSVNLDQDLVPPAGSEEQQSMVAQSTTGQCSELSPQTETHRSSKRSRVETPEHPHEDLPGNQHDVLGSEITRHKKARRENVGQSSKNKTMKLEKCNSHLNDKKKTKKSSSGNKEFRSENEPSSHPDHRNPLPLCVTDDPDVGNKQLDYLQTPLRIENILDFPHDEKDTGSKSVTDPKLYRKTLKLPKASETRNSKETFVVYRQKTLEKSVSPKSRRTSVSSDDSDKAVHQNMGDLLMTRLPVNLTTAQTESSSLLSSPSREGEPGGSVTATAEASPAGRVLTMVTNTMMTLDSENKGRSRRRNCAVSYKEPLLNSKLRRGDKHTESTFLSSPLFKDTKRKKQLKIVD